MIERPSGLLARIEHAAARDGAVTFVGADPGLADRVPWAQLHADALAMAGQLQARGVEPGQHVALLGPTSRPLVTAIQAIWLAGATLVALPLPMRLGSLDEFVDQTRLRISHADASIVLMDEALSAFLEPRHGDPPAVCSARSPAEAGPPSRRLRPTRTGWPRCSSPADRRPNPRA
jgi:fatty-acyl-CoA synthase